MISKACDMLGMGGVPIKEKNNKVKLEALKVISKLDFDIACLPKYPHYWVAGMFCLSEFAV